MLLKTGEIEFSDFWTGENSLSRAVGKRQNVYRRGAPGNCCLVEQEHPEVSIRRQCELLGVSRAGLMPSNSSVLANGANVMCSRCGSIVTVCREYTDSRNRTPFWPGYPETALPGAIVSLLLFLGCDGTYRFVSRLEKQDRYLIP